MDAVVYVENPKVGKTKKYILKNVTTVDVTDDEFYLRIENHEPVLITISNDTHLHFYKNYLNQ